MKTSCPTTTTLPTCIPPLISSSFPVPHHSSLMSENSIEHCPARGGCSPVCDIVFSHFIPLDLFSVTLKYLFCWPQIYCISPHGNDIKFCLMLVLITIQGAEKWDKNLQSFRFRQSQHNRELMNSRSEHLIWFNLNCS